MKKLLLSLCIFLSICCCGFSKALCDSDLEVVHKVMDAKLFTGDYEKPEEKRAYIEKVEKELSPLFVDLSEEARIICKNILFLEKENTKKKEEKSEELINNCYSEYKTYSDSHKDLSAHFYFHQKEAEMAKAVFLSLPQQLNLFKGIIEEYKSLEALDPDYSETTFMLGAILYFAPKIAGGNKEEGISKIKLSVNNAACDYEYATSLITLSQFLFEEKKYDEAKLYLNQAIEKFPENKTITELAKMNSEGYSMFQIEKYKKAKKKK